MNGQHVNLTQNRIGNTTYTNGYVGGQSYNTYSNGYGNTTYTNGTVGRDHRSDSLEKLKNGELDVIFSVDVFNEGMDLPEIDTVMMLRPTESRVLWLQQLGRGLRKTADKQHLVVIDYIGNHRTFLVKLQTLFMELAACSRGSDAELRQLLDQLAKGKLVLPDGCDVTYELETLDILAGLLRTVKAEALTLWLQDFRTRYDRRPTASETFHEGYNPRAVHKDYGSWLNYLRVKEALSDSEVGLFESHRQFLTMLGATAMTKSYKMVLLEAMLSRVSITEPIGIDELTAAFIQRARRSRRVAQDVSVSLDDFEAVRSLLVRNPISAWTGGKEGVAFFTYEGGVFRSTVRSEDAPGLSELAREIVEWRLAEYLDRNLLDEGGVHDGFLAKVSQTQGRPILFLDRRKFPNTPDGDQTLWVEGAPYTASFVKIALNKVVKGEERANLLPSFLRGWFGPDAGQPGTMHQVQFTPAETGWAMSPVGVKLDSELVVGHRYAREQIPRFFGMTFSKAIWSSGVVRGAGVIILLVTMNKETLLADHQYADRFLAPDLFQWQSQNRTTQGSTFGQLLRNHVQNGVDVHLFIRAEKKTNGISQPFRYCGKVEFESWEGEQPITVVWRLTARLTEELEAIT